MNAPWFFNTARPQKAAANSKCVAFGRQWNSVLCGQAAREEAVRLSGPGCGFSLSKPVAMVGCQGQKSGPNATRYREEVCGKQQRIILVGSVLPRIVWEVFSLESGRSLGAREYQYRPASGALSVTMGFAHLLETYSVNIE